jgi:hypothetical protein
VCGGVEIQIRRWINIVDDRYRNSELPEKRAFTYQPKQKADLLKCWPH